MTSPHPARRRVLAAVCVLAVVGFVTLLLVTEHGVGISTDSVIYVDGARNIRAGRGYTIPGSMGDLTPITHFPPLYSALLAAVSGPGADVLEGARWLNAALFAATIWLVGLALARHTPAPPPVPLLGSFLILTSASMFAIFSMAWTEPPFIFLMLLCLLGLARYVETGSARSYLLAGAAAGLALLTRYAGVALIPVGALCIVGLRRAAWRERLRDALLFGVVAAVPIAGWVIRNMLLAGSATDRHIILHPITRQYLGQAALTVANWLVPNALPRQPRLFVLLALVVVLIAILLARRISGAAAGRVRRGTLTQVCAIFIAAYLLFLMVSISFLDAHTPLNNRILSPVYVALVIVVLSVRPADLAPVTGPRAARGILLTVGALYVLSCSVQAANWTLANRDDAQQYASRAWRESGTIRELAELPPGTPIYTNAPDAVIFHTGRPAVAVPDKVWANTRQLNADYEQELAAMEDAMRDDGAVFAYFDAAAWRWYLPALAEMEERLTMHLSVDTEDGAIYRYGEAESSLPGR